MFQSPAGHKLFWRNNRNGKFSLSWGCRCQDFAEVDVNLHKISIKKTKNYAISWLSKNFTKNAHIQISTHEFKLFWITNTIWRKLTSKSNVIKLLSTTNLLAASDFSSFGIFALSAIRYAYMYLKCYVSFFIWLEFSPQNKY